MDFKKLIYSKEYEFLHTDPRLGDRIMLLGLSGSYGYGTNREDSDIDFRGVTLNLPSDLIGLTSYEQFEDRRTDTVIYSFNKLISLILNCNPNTIEILGLDEDQYVIKSKWGQALLDNRHIFLSKRAAETFGHYAGAQLRRLQNAQARDSMSQEAREKHILKSVTNALKDVNRRHENWDKGKLKLYIDQAESPELEKEIFIDADYRHFPLRGYTEIMSTMHNVVRDYDRIGKRNNKKDDNHLNKHAMHLVRLFMMGIDILKEGIIRTHRPETDLKLLMSIRNGDYMENGIMTPAFYEIVTDYEQRFETARVQSRLPDDPDFEAVEKLVENINRHVVMEEYLE